MITAVYTIALNEEENVADWYASARDANILMVADTGSTDYTISRLKQHNIMCPKLAISPWRFDDARNAALALLPAEVDFCIALDMDERLAPGWRDEVERCHAAGATRLRYKYVWSHTEDGSDGLAFFRDGAHARHGYRWVHPVHEVLKPDRIEEKLVESSVTVHHWPNHRKSRSQYLGLLAQSVKENPDDDRNAHYYARELFFYGRMGDAAAEFKRHLALPSATWKAERAMSYRYLAKCEPMLAAGHLLSARVEDRRREVLVDLAKHFHDTKNWDRCRYYALEALKITDKPLDYMCEEFAWGSAALDYAAISSYWTGDSITARMFGRMAAEMEPNNERLKANLAFYSG
jgi:hypothetical protein